MIKEKEFKLIKSRNKSFTPLKLPTISQKFSKRLENRTSTPDLKEITLRLNRFDYEESKIGMYDYVLKNNNLEKTVDIIMDIIKHESSDEENDF